MEKLGSESAIFISRLVVTIKKLLNPTHTKNIKLFRF